MEAPVPDGYLMVEQEVLLAVAFPPETVEQVAHIIPPVGQADTAAAADVPVITVLPAAAAAIMAAVAV
jgi:hypothetical protein